MGKSFSQLTIIERSKIEAYLKLHLSFKEIARCLERSASTISREVNAHKVLQIKNGYNQVEVYDAEAAQRMANFSASKKGANLKIDKDFKTAQVLENLLLAGYSPYAALQIAKKHHHLRTSLTVRTVYNYIYHSVFVIDESCMVYGRRKKKEEKEDFKKRKTAYNPLKYPSIEDRPKSVLSRREFGHWEMDTVCGSTKSDNSAAFLTLIERKTRFLIVKALDSRSQKCVLMALDDIEKNLGKDTFKSIFKSITMDNGIEFLDPDGIKASRYGSSEPRITDLYYCHPYCSSERGSNEVVHRFLRRKWPKGTDLSTVNKDELIEHVRFINTYPRKLFDGQSASDRFYYELSLS